MSSESSNKHVIQDAINQGNILLAKKLIDEYPNQLYQKDEDGRIPLSIAISSNNSDLVEYILSKTPKNIDIDDYVDDSGFAATHIAASIGNALIFNRLMRLDPTPDVNLKTNIGTTCLHLAISKNHYEIVKELVETYKANARVQDRLGNTPLHRAAAIGSQPIVKLLVEKGKVGVNAKNKDGLTALDEALTEGHGDVAVLLVKLGADPEVNKDIHVDEKVATFYKTNI
ncbi:NAS6 Probable 26S proteasome regulatory subunit p28 [Candida maltosa Xu316]|uniref:Putative proteasome-interacting protein n=1 Tax=Candida maltosa (strain Xu316) TaxID=1245528 RepID=M3HNV4_CANMX|nr:putative proteasome-interacting protein [Candida maltosa Xu316]